MGTKVFDNFMYGYEKKLRVLKFHSAHTPGIKNEWSLIKLGLLPFPSKLDTSESQVFTKIYIREIL